ncbi:MAG: hypothetical protein J0H66_03980 [Solirubrobacterales bacterium]|nr:hypothetical protein [Solirubrobacterales bacterium]OJU96247.1 MAG: hypothetical protein BGO23_01650 [Solirubrobacterales bacterium 67-14]
MVRRAGPVLVAALCVGLLITAAPAGARFIPGLNRVAADKGEVYRKGCMSGHDQVRSGPCRFGDRDSNKKVVLFGDSHAMQWGPGLILLAEEKGWQVIALTRASCPASLVHIDYFCDTWRRNSLRRIRRMRPGLVLVASAANFEAYEAGDLDREASEHYLVDGMIRILRKLRRWSRKTVVMRDQAVTPFNVTMCLRSNVATPGRCGFRWTRPLAFAYDYKAARRVKKVPIIDPQPMLCPGGWCHAVDHDVLVYRNQGHLSASFVLSKYQWIGRKLGDPWR